MFNVEIVLDFSSPDELKNRKFLITKESFAVTYLLISN
jgi:hypothetical protein